MAFAVLGNHQQAWELLEMINPVNHTQTPETVAVYKNEPYVVSADVYALSPHVGRGRMVVVYRFRRVVISTYGGNLARPDAGRA